MTGNVARRASRSILTVAVLAMMVAGALAFVVACPDPADADGGWHPAYDTLSKSQQRAYAALEDGIPDGKKSIDVSYLNVDDAHEVMYAFASDYPEYFWFMDAYVLYSWTAEDRASDIRAESALDMRDLKAKMSEVQTVVDSIEIPAGGDADRLRAAHDWIDMNVTYDKQTANAGNVYGAFVENRVKCDGYSYALNLLCKAQGIQSVCVTGVVIEDKEYHAWNMVSMADRWYYVDVTWDDPGCPGAAEYDYFLIGSRTSTPAGAFADSRTVTVGFGLEPSAVGYGYDPYPDGYWSDCIVLNYEKAKEGASRTGDWYYDVKGMEVHISAAGYRTIAAIIGPEDIKWGVLVVKSPASQAVEGEGSADYTIAMYAGAREVSLEDEGLAGKIYIVAPDCPSSGIWQPRYYGPDGELLTKGSKLELQSAGTFTVGYVKPVGSLGLMVAMMLVAGAMMVTLFLRVRRAQAVAMAVPRETDGCFCPECGAPMDKGASFCYRCGRERRSVDRVKDYLHAVSRPVKGGAVAVDVPDLDDWVRGDGLPVLAAERGRAVEYAERAGSWPVGDIPGLQLRGPPLAGHDRGERELPVDHAGDHVDLQGDGLGEPNGIGQVGIVELGAENPRASPDVDLLRHVSTLRIRFFLSKSLRISLPTTSIWSFLSSSSILFSSVRPLSYSALHWVLKVPSSISLRIWTMASLDCWVTTLSLLVMPPYSAVLETTLHMRSKPPLLIRSTMSLVSWRTSK